MEDVEFSNACKEVLEILKFIKKEDVIKIPKKEIELLEKNENKNFHFTYNPKKNIKEQNVSKLAKGIIAVYFYKYIATDKQKETIRKKQEYDFKQIEEEKIKKYSTNNMFKPKENNQINNNQDNKQIACVKRDNFITKIIKKLFGLFKKNK